MKRAASQVLLALLAAAILPAQPAPSETAEVDRMIRDASRAIQAGNAARFLSYFDGEEFPEYPALRANVVALTSQRQIASSIEITELQKREHSYQVRIVWLLQLTYTGDPGPVEARREEVACTVKQRGKSWKLVHFAPASLFRP